MNLFGTVINSRTVSFTWDAPLEENRNGIIRQYFIRVIEVDTGRQFEVVSTTNSISVSSLHPYYTYQWAVSAFTIGTGPFTEFQNISTPEDGRLRELALYWFKTICLLLSVPSGAPQTLKIVETGVTNISLTWQHPLSEDRNGVIRGFIVRLSSIPNRETREISSVHTNITVTSLTPYTIYECTVAAYTTVGSGPPSGIILARTEPTSKYFVV